MVKHGAAWPPVEQGLRDLEIRTPLPARGWAAPKRKLRENSDWPPVTSPLRRREREKHAGGCRCRIS